MASPQKKAIPTWAKLAGYIVIPAGSVGVGLALALLLVVAYDQLADRLYDRSVPGTAKLGFKVASLFILLAAPATAVLLDYLTTRLSKTTASVTLPVMLALLVPGEWLVVGAVSFVNACNLGEGFPFAASC